MTAGAHTPLIQVVRLARSFGAQRSGDTAIHGSEMLEDMVDQSLRQDLAQCWQPQRPSFLSRLR